MAENDGLIIGLTGSINSGCKTVADYLENKGFKKLSLTTEIKRVAEKDGYDFTTENLQNIGDDLRKKGYEYLAKVVSEEIDKSSDKARFVVKSFRNHHEVDYFRRKYASFTLFSIDAERDIRCKRGNYSREEIFDREDERDSGEEQPEYGQHVRLCVDRSDVVINNNEDERSLFSKIDKYIDLIDNPGKSSPSRHETSMAHACRESTKNGCLKRAVGAVIVEEKGRKEEIISLGYNSTPGNISSCKELGSVCYRESSRKCPHCGVDIQVILEKCNKCNNNIEKQKRIELNKNLDLCRAIHAEERAILRGVNIRGNYLEGTILYTTTFPCILCAKKIVEVGIKKVWYIDPYPFRDAKDLLLRAKVEISKFEGVKSRAYDRLYMA